ncbi:hypothetical protein B0H63DRAFT_446175 [Podospora didyma]|uniref:Ecp2 effector protein domain-containing protein n=1 Tax=Podospora didyma TaxID=330526 RepID=A0AAE0U3Z2_9PEZI|nr:hypothetical protein B0H63DRAFT_446175 [Podospora didyma]
MGHINALKPFLAVSFCSVVLGAPTPAGLDRPQPDPHTPMDKPDTLPWTSPTHSHGQARHTPTDKPGKGFDPKYKTKPGQPESSDDSDSALSKRVVINGESCVLWLNTAYPYSAMGKLADSAGGVCTAVIVGSRFQPAYDNGERLDGSDVIAVFESSLYQGVDGSTWYDEAYDFAVFVTSGQVSDQHS